LLGRYTHELVIIDEYTREVLGLSENEEPVAFTPLGYPADESKPKKRKALSDLIRY
jgi:nitroreductase